MEDYFYPDSSLHNPPLDVTDQVKREKVISLCKPFRLTKDNCIKIKKIFADQMDKGLSSDVTVRKSSCLLMENTFMSRFPTGKETGHYLSLDLGSTNFRVIMSRLHGHETEDGFSVKYYDVADNLRVGSYVPLFDFLAECIEDFLSGEEGLKGKKIPLGFSFSYPMVQQSVDSGFLVTWTKSYDLPDAIGKDAVQLLRDALKKRGNNQVNVVAIINDSTGTLLKGAYLDADCAVGMIFGSGFNCCFIEQVSRIQKLTQEQRQNLSGCSKVAIDIECGAFGDNGCIDWVRTGIDREVDEDSLYNKSFSFEKMFAGNFLGDVGRRIILKLAQEGVLMQGVVTAALKTKDSLKAHHLVDFERVGEKSIRKVLSESLGYPNASDDDVRIIFYVGRIIAIRAAILTSTLLSCLLDRIGMKRCVIAIDGSLYSNHPMIHKLMMDVIRELSPGQEFDIIEAKDGSGKGAGLAAACCV